MHWRSHRAVLWVGGALIALTLALLPFALAQVGTSWVRITNYAILYVLLALGLNIVVGFAGLLDLGYVAFYAVGAYTYALLASPHFGLHLPFWIVLPIGAAVAALFGVLLGIVEALGAGYIGDLTNLCQYDVLASRIDDCAGGGNFVLFGSNYQDVFAFLVLILVLVFRPSGLLGERVGDRA